MKILLTFNESFAPHGAAVISGLLKYASKPISVAILYTDMRAETISSLKEYYDNRLESIEFHKVDVNSKLALKFRNIISQPHLSGKIETYLRLFATQYLNDDEVIYLDCDIVVKDDVYKMLDEVDYNSFVSGVREYDPKHYYLDFGNLDAFTKPSYEEYFYRNAFFMRTLKYYKMSNDSSYLCCGIMHLNLKKWREENLVEKLMRKIDETNLFFCADQDVMNSVIDGHFGVVSPRWNTIVAYSGVMANYTSEQYKEARENPAIVHLPGSSKPWLKGAKGKYVDEYWELRKDTPWPIRDEIETTVTTNKPIALKLYHKFTSVIVRIANKLNSIGREPKRHPFASIFSEELKQQKQ